MIEIVFNDSACGSLKVAQRFGKGKYPGTAISVFIRHEDGSEPTVEELEKAKREAEERHRLAWENATPIGGTSADVFGFDLGLSVGEIKNLEERWLNLEKLYRDYPEEEKRYMKEKMEHVGEKIKRVFERMEVGEELRIWYSNNPDEMCGLYWFMDQLNQSAVKYDSLILVKLPEWEEGENTITLKNSWGEVAAEEWSRYLPLQQKVSAPFVKRCAFHWRDLQKENAPLRAVVNGQLLSVSEDMYDKFILCELEMMEEEFREGKLIASVFKYNLGIGDVWIHSRIEKMISEGKVEVVAEAEKDMPMYRRMLKRKLWT